MTFVSLFAGIGGIDLGLERAGMQCVGQVELDPFARRILTKHWPDVPKHDDVRTFHGSEFGPFDLLTGGYPCQPFSLAGTRRGEGDERHLWPEVLRIIRNVRPRLVLLENVPGHLSLGFGRVLGDLAESGYDAEWDCIPASAVGAPHRRDRVWIVAYPNRKRPHPGTPPSDSRPIRHLLGNRSEPQSGRDELEPRVARVGRWEPEPNVGGTADGLSSGTYGGLNGDEVGSAEARTTATPVTSRTEMREVRVNKSTTTASRRLPEPRRLPGPVPPVPREGRPGGGIQKEAQHEGVQGLREVVSPLTQQEAQHVQQGVFGGTWPQERRKALGAAWGEDWERGVPRVANAVPSRADRLRALGNAVVPQVAELIGRRLMEVFA